MSIYFKNKNEKQECNFCDFVNKQIRSCITSPVFFILSFAILGFIIIFFHYNENSEGITMLMWAFACMSIGALIGFLFGIPKTKQKRKKDSIKQTNAKYIFSSENNSHGTNQEPNTNLEDVSDWLTKILIGVGLVEIEKIGPSLYSLAEVLGKSISQTSTGTNDHLMYALALIIYFLIIGFFFGYLSTRIIISREFLKADNLDLEEVKGQLYSIEARVREHEEISALVSQADEYRSIARILKDMNNNQINSEKIIKERIRFMERSKLVLKQVRDLDPKNIPAAIGMAKYYARSEVADYPRAIEILTNIIATQTDQPTITMSRVYYNRACYYNRLAENERNTGLDNIYFKSAVNDLNEAIKLNPYYREFLEYDSDWEIIKDSDAFKRSLCTKSDTKSS